VQADAEVVPPTTVHPVTQSSNGHAAGNGQVAVDLDEQVVIARMGDAIADAASTWRDTVGEDRRQAARRAAIDIATATLSASSAETAAHSDDVDVISEGIARRLGLSGQRLEDVMVAARLHDIGKLGVPPHTINKPGPLNQDEWAVMRRHTIIGEQILLAVPELRGAAHLVRHSHERWDGNGYPDGLAGEQIPLGSRIVFCADAFHAIRSDRPYRAGRSAPEALAVVRACAGTQFDPAVVEALEAVAAELRTAENGHRPRSFRGRRLMALMLIVSVGSCSSALARSGLMPEPKSPHTAGAASIGAASSGTAAPGPTGQPTGSSGAVPDPTARADSFGASSDLRSLSLLKPGLGLVPDADGVGPNPFGVAVPGTPAGADSPHGDDRPGVRDHGQGRGRGKGQGKGRGAELGRGHGKTRKAKPHGNRASSHGASRANAHTSSSRGGSAKPKHSSDAPAAQSGSSRHAKSGQVAGNGQASTTKPPKLPTAPKPPKVTTPPTVTPPTDPAPAPGSGNGNPAAGGTSGGSNSSGNGHG
jgi:hypothetical protein